MPTTREKNDQVLVPARRLVRLPPTRSPTDPVEGRAVLLQAGSFGEHCFTRARLETRGSDDQSVEVNGKYLRIHLGAGAQARLHLGMQRFASQPSYALPPFK